MGRTGSTHTPQTKTLTGRCRAGPAQQATCIEELPAWCMALACPSASGAPPPQPQRAGPAAASAVAAAAMECLGEGSQVG
jgi:hypothetical protein